MGNKMGNKNNTMKITQSYVYFGQGATPFVKSELNLIDG